MLGQLLKACFEFVVWPKLEALSQDRCDLRIRRNQQLAEFLYCSPILLLACLEEAFLQSFLRLLEC